MTATPSDNAAVISDCKPTPGPWQMDITPDEWVEIFHADNQNVVAICARQLGFNTDVDAQSIANARLISASPDLLDAIKMLLADPDALENIDFAHAVIRKAEAGQ